jgi:hypothetical protein
METTSSKRCLKKFLFFAATGFLLVAGMSVDALAQSRGGRGANVGGVRPVGGATRPGREVIVAPVGRGSIHDSPMPTGRVRRVPDVDLTPRDERERREREERERERRDIETRREAARRQNDEANRFQKLGRWLGVSPERLQNFYLEAKEANPELRLSQFFASLVIANRLNSSNPNVTPQAILRGLDAGMSMEPTLVALGLSGEDAKAAAKWAERIVNHLKP